jgi:hypothetical protein
MVKQVASMVEDVELAGKCVRECEQQARLAAHLLDGISQSRSEQAQALARSAEGLSDEIHRARDLLDEVRAS